MSSQAKRYKRHETTESAKSMLLKAERELSEGYLEVEITGITFRRLVVTYKVILREAWTHTMGNVRSLLRPTPAL